MIREVSFFESLDEPLDEFWNDSENCYQIFTLWLSRWDREAAREVSEYVAVSDNYDTLLDWYNSQFTEYELSDGSTHRAFKPRSILKNYNLPEMDVESQMECYCTEDEEDLIELLEDCVFVYDA